MKIKMFRSIVPPLTMSLTLLIASTRIAMAGSLFFDNFAQFTNGTDLTSTNYVPASGPVSASVITRIDNGSPTIVATNFLGNTWAFFHNSAVPNKDDYRGYLSSTQTNQPLEITWKMWIQATNSGNGAFSLSVPVHDPANPGITYNPPLAFLDTGTIIGLTNGTSVRIPIGNWGSLAGTVMTNTLILDYPDGTFSYSLNGQTLATLPLGPYFTNLVDSITFTGFERDPSSLGNRFAISDVKVEVVPSAPKSSFLWAKRIVSVSEWPGGEPKIGISLDSQDNCYATGFFDGTNDFGGITLTNQSIGGQDIFVAKYNSTGTLQWAKRAGGTSHNNGRGVGVDTNENVYVTGGYYGPADFGDFHLPASTYENFFLAKYNSTGTVQWVRQSAGGNDDIYGTGLTVDDAGDCYALMFVDGSQGGTTLTFGSTTVPITNNYTGNSTILIKYDNTGTVQWARVIGGVGGVVYCTRDAVDGDGNVYVTGTFNGSMSMGATNFTSTGMKDGFVAKFSSMGDLQWARQMTGAGNDSSLAVSVDTSGNVYAAGGFGNVAGDTISFAPSITLTNIGGGITGMSSGDAFVAKYDGSSGVVRWARRAGGTNADGYTGVSTDAHGHIYVGGAFGSTNFPSFSGAVMAEYDANGAVQWAQSSFGRNGAFTFAGPRVDNAGNICVAGWYQGAVAFGTNILQSQGTWNFFLAKVAPPVSPTLSIALTNGFAQLSVAGDIGSLFSLQQSPILPETNTSWQPLTTLMLTNRPESYLDKNAPSGTKRFYRAGPPAL